jgi:hypothetical protein
MHGDPSFIVLRCQRAGFLDPIEVNMKIPALLDYDILAAKLKIRHRDMFPFMTKIMMPVLLDTGFLGQ